jgi:DGQHR domain-containing protein
MADQYELRLPCLAVTQGDRSLFSFAVDGKRLHHFTAVARVGRDAEARLAGYQRPEVIKHVRGIQRYLETPNALLPNAIVVAFDERVRFEPLPVATPEAITFARHGTLVVPIDETADDADKPGWIVDGQQRSAALRNARLTDFPVCVVGFIADQAEQRAQFILVNNTRPLPKGLIHELLPATRAQLPVNLMRRRLAAEILHRLNLDADSPFHHLIATPTHPNGVIKDNAVLRMVENTIYNGALYQYRRADTGDADIGAMISHLKIYWNTVAQTFPEAWGLLPRQSRLSHGVGVAAMGYVMDELTEDAPLSGVGSQSAHIHVLGDCPWTCGEWHFEEGSRRWNSLQNTPQDIRMLTGHLLDRIRAAALKQPRYEVERESP